MKVADTESRILVEVGSIVIEAVNESEREAASTERLMDRLTEYVCVWLLVSVGDVENVSECVGLAVRLGEGVGEAVTFKLAERDSDNDASTDPFEKLTVTDGETD
ncbi:MAG: hypothetical protein FJ267_09820 [Planctomycetes bacterium]|nr:hypothetical protein [Planctomycetota bacterium]